MQENIRSYFLSRQSHGREQRLKRHGPVKEAMGGAVGLPHYVRGGAAPGGSPPLRELRAALTIQG